MDIFTFLDTAIRSIADIGQTAWKIAANIVKESSDEPRKKEE